MGSLQRSKSIVQALLGHDLMVFIERRSLDIKDRLKFAPALLEMPFRPKSEFSDSGRKPWTTVRCFD